MYPTLFILGMVGYDELRVCLTLSSYIKLNINIFLLFDEGRLAFTIYLTMRQLAFKYIKK